MTINWSLCFLCQLDKKENVRSSIEGYNSLAKNLPLFHEKDRLNFNYDRIKEKYINLLDTFITKKAVYHKNCFLNYSDSRLNRVLKSPKKRKATTSKTGKKATRLSTESNKRFDLYFCWCSQKDDEDNLISAGTYHAKKKIKRIPIT